MKPERWYSTNPNNVEEYIVFDTMLVENSLMVSIIKKQDIQYYRNNFTLRKSET